MRVQQRRYYYYGELTALTTSEVNNMIQLNFSALVQISQHVGRLWKSKKIPDVLLTFHPSQVTCIYQALVFMVLQKPL